MDGALGSGIMRSVMVGPWPWSLLNLLSVAVWVVAVVGAWQSADRVVRINRPWTRAWLILLASCGVGLNGIWFPFGACYAAIRYRPGKRRPPGLAPTSAPMHP